MSKLYKTNSKHLVPIHQPSFPDVYDLEENDEILIVEELEEVSF